MYLLHLYSLSLSVNEPSGFAYNKQCLSRLQKWHPLTNGFLGNALWHSYWLTININFIVAFALAVAHCKGTLSVSNRIRNRFWHMRYWLPSNIVIVTCGSQRWVIKSLGIYCFQRKKVRCWRYVLNGRLLLPYCSSDCLVQNVSFWHQCNFKTNQWINNIRLWS